MGLLANYDKLGCDTLALEIGKVISNKDARILDVGAGSGFGAMSVSPYFVSRSAKKEKKKTFLQLQ